MLVAEYDGADNRLRLYTPSPRAETPLLWLEGSLNFRVLYTDERGSVVAAAVADGSYTVINTYDEYGVPGAGNVGRFQYTGQAWLGELGMYYYKARIYSPTLGRFMQTDPIGYADQFNLYAYVGDDPANRTDPEGRQILEDSERENTHGLNSYLGEARDTLMAGADAASRVVIKVLAVFYFAPAVAEGVAAAVASRAAPAVAPLVERIAPRVVARTAPRVTVRVGNTVIIPRPVAQAVAGTIDSNSPVARGTCIPTRHSGRTCCGEPIYS